jgi:Sigma-70, region 4
MSGVAGQNPNAARKQAIARTLTGYAGLDAATRRAIDRNLAALGDTEQEVIRLRFGHDRASVRSSDGRSNALRDLNEVGRHLDLTAKRVRQIEARAFSKMAHPHMTWPEDVSVDWWRSAEVLLLRVESLVARSENLERQLAGALDDARLARARVAHLEDLVSMLRRELYETGSKSSRRWTGAVASLTLVLLGGFLGGIGEAGGADLLDDLRDAQDAAVVVVHECGATDDSPAP